MKKTFQAAFISLIFLVSRPLIVPAAPAGSVIFWGYGIDANTSPSMFSHGVVTIAGQVLTNAVAISAGTTHALAIRSDGTVVGWGLNNEGQATGIPTADRANGVVKIDGQILSNVVAIAAGVGSSLALKSDGTIAAWGRQMGGIKMGVASGLSNVVSIADGWFGLVVKGDGTIVDIQGNQYKSLSNSVAVAVQPGGSNGGNVIHVLALKDDATVVELALGYEPPVPVGVSNVVAIAAGQTRNVALKKDGTVVGWGYANDVPAGLSNVVAISAGRRHSLALKNDGTVIAWGSLGFQPATAPERLSNVVAIAAGGDYCLAIITNSAVADKFRH